jgi:hypothetical protein
MSTQTSRISTRRAKRRTLRREFLRRLATELAIVWPIMSGLILLIIAAGVIIGRFEGWPLGDSFYFSFVTGLTIGYGDLVPKMLITRVLAIAIGAMGILLTALLAAVAVKALGGTGSPEDGS